MLGELKKSSVALLEREPRGQGKSEAATYGKGQVSETYEPCYRNVDCILRTRGSHPRASGVETQLYLYF